MLFTSPSFYILFALVLALFFLLPWRWGKVMLVLASYLFYSTAEVWYCLLLLGSTVIDYYIALRIDNTQSPQQRKAWLWFSIIANLSILAVFKYADFGISNLNVALEYFHITPFASLSLILPIGISFYTFQTMSYTIDVYRGQQKPSRDFISFALYVSFFPQLVAGPIERARNLLPQFERKPKVSWDDLSAGFQRVLWGLTKKLVFADRLALTVNAVFSNPAGYNGFEIALASVCFSFQLYLDFSAYVDIAIGLARMMGVRLSENFNYPFLARNPSDFWARWHITLTQWFRDYLFRALGGNRRSSLMRTAFTTIFVMSLMGFWHGAAWNYIAFGFVSALSVVLYTQLRIRSGRKKLFGTHPLASFLAWLGMFLWINLIMIIFRAQTLPAAWEVMQRLVVFEGEWHEQFYISLGLLIIVTSFHIARGMKPKHFKNIQMPELIRAFFWVGMCALFYFLQLDTTEQFIYFQF
ncbi:MAG: MBOAT family O-acyltransferase [Arenicellales bacterium]